MTSDTFSFPARDGVSIFTRRWSGAEPPRGIVQLAHGAAEHSGRYDRFARFLTANGFRVYANDHRGHGQTRVRSRELGDAGPDAWNHFVDDVRELTQLIRREAPNLPIVLFGHSMGSFIVQDYMARYGADLAGAVLCATNGRFRLPPEALAHLNEVTARDPLGPSAAMTERFAKYNDQFKPGVPGFDWLSRDAAEVEKYKNDPLCGFRFSNELARDFLKGLNDLFSPDNEARVPRDLPILIIAGDQDPVGGNTEGIKPLIERYRARGLQRVDVKFYPGARHELLNEINRDEVHADVLRWLHSIA